MRLHDFLDLPTVLLARSENTKRELKIVLGWNRWQSETGNEKRTTLRKCCFKLLSGCKIQCLLIHSHSKIIITRLHRLRVNTSGTWTLGTRLPMNAQEFYCVRRHDHVFMLWTYTRDRRVKILISCLNLGQKYYFKENNYKTVIFRFMTFYTKGFVFIL